VVGLGVSGGNATVCEKAKIKTLPFVFGTDDTIKSEVKQ
jgi:hypothetical protein